MQKMEAQEGDVRSSEAPKVKGRGGLIALPFIIANEMLEKVAGVGLNTNMIVYLTNQYHMSTADAQTMIFVCSAVSNFTPIAGGVIADMYLGRFIAVATGSIACLIGMAFLWLSAMLPGVPPCGVGPAPELCKPPRLRHLAWLLAGNAFLAIGAGGVRPCSMAFGADQFSRHPKEKRSRILQAYFNAYYASIGVAFTVAVTAIVYVQDNVGWKVGFAIPMGLMLLSSVSFLLGSSLYIKEKGSKQMFSGIGTAVVAVIKNRKARLPAKTEDGVYHHLMDCKLIVPTDKMRFLNKACMIGSTREDAPGNGADAAASGRHGSSDRRLCTVDQVEQLKSALRILPIWSSTIFLTLVMYQSIPVKQGERMDRRVGRGGFLVPSGSLPVFSMITLSLWSSSYDRWIVPALRRVTGNPRGLTVKQRIGGGLLLATAAMAVSAVVEEARRRLALGRGGATLSVFWLVPQYTLVGLAEAFGVIGEIEFFYTELPKSVASFSMSLLYLAMGMGNLFGGLIVQVVNEASGRGGKTSWLVDDANMGRYDYYYWLLTGYGAVNFVYFLWCGWVYGEEGKNVEWEEEGEKEPPMA